MRSPQWNTLAVTLACLLSAGFMVPGLVVAGSNQVDICHFHPGLDNWSRWRVEAASALKHLEYHDDALPGGKTTQTHTFLDADCNYMKAPHLKLEAPGPRRQSFVSNIIRGIFCSKPGHLYDGWTGKCDDGR